MTVRSGAREIIEQIKEYPEFRSVQIVHILEAIGAKLLDQANLAKDMNNPECAEIDLQYKALLTGAIAGIKAITGDEWGMTDQEIRDMFED